MRTLSISLALSLVIGLACGPTTPGGSSSSGGGADTSPPMACDGPGESLLDEPCATDCDCCGLWCADYTPADGGAPTRACASDCMGKVRP